MYADDTIDTIYNEDRTERVRIEHDCDYPFSIESELEGTDLELYVGERNDYMSSIGTGDYRRALDEFDDRGMPTAFIRYMRIFHDTEVLPVFMLVHSAVRLSTGGFGCPWDSGLAGFAFIHPEAKGLYTNPERAIKGMVEHIDDLLNGNVYGLIHEYKVSRHVQTHDANGDMIRDEWDEGEWDELDACWGFIGDEYAEQEARAMLGLKAVAA